MNLNLPFLDNLILAVALPLEFVLIEYFLPLKINVTFFFESALPLLSFSVAVNFFTFLEALKVFLGTFKTGFFLAMTILDSFDVE